MLLDNISQKLLERLSLAEDEQQKEKAYDRLITVGKQDIIWSLAGPIGMAHAKLRQISPHYSLEQYWEYSGEILPLAFSHPVFAQYFYTQADRRGKLYLCALYYHITDFIPLKLPAINFSPIKDFYPTCPDADGAKITSFTSLFGLVFNKAVINFDEKYFILAYLISHAEFIRKKESIAASGNLDSSHEDLKKGLREKYAALKAKASGLDELRKIMDSEKEELRDADKRFSSSTNVTPSAVVALMEQIIEKRAKDFPSDAIFKIYPPRIYPGKTIDLKEIGPDYILVNDYEQEKKAILLELKTKIEQTMEPDELRSEYQKKLITLIDRINLYHSIQELPANAADKLSNIKLLNNLVNIFKDNEFNTIVLDFSAKSQEKAWLPLIHSLFPTKNQDLVCLALHSMLNKIAASNFSYFLRYASAKIVVSYATKYLGHTNYVNCVSFAPDGKDFASASSDGSIKVWNVASRLELRHLSGHNGSVNSLAFSPEGNYLASASSDKTIRIWDIAQSRMAKVLLGHLGDVLCVDYSPDGNFLVSGGMDNLIKLWDAQTGQEIITLRGHSHYVNAVKFSPDGKIIASASSDKTVKLWDAKSARLLNTLNGHHDAVYCLSFTSDNQLLASGSGDTSIKIWNINVGIEMKTITGHINSVLSLAFSPDDMLLVSGSSSTVDKIKIWDVYGENELKSLNGHADDVLTVSFSPDQEYIISGSYKDIKLWDLFDNTRSSAEMLALKGLTSHLLYFLFNTDGDDYAPLVKAKKDITELPSSVQAALTALFERLIEKASKSM